MNCIVSAWKRFYDPSGGAIAPSESCKLHPKNYDRSLLSPDDGARSPISFHAEPHHTELDTSDLSQGDTKRTIIPYHVNRERDHIESMVVCVLG